jgi:hypothetical protein
MTYLIKDLPVSKELDSKRLGSLRGGFNSNAGNINAAIGGNYGSPAIVVAPVTQVDFGGYPTYAYCQPTPPCPPNPCEPYQPYRLG